MGSDLGALYHELYLTELYRELPDKSSWYGELRRNVHSQTSVPLSGLQRLNVKGSRKMDRLGRMHSAEHILTAVMRREYGSAIPSPYKCCPSRRPKSATTCGRYPRAQRPSASSRSVILMLPPVPGNT